MFLLEGQVAREEGDGEMSRTGVHDGKLPTLVLMIHSLHLQEAEAGGVQ